MKGFHSFSQRGSEAHGSENLQTTAEVRKTQGLEFRCFGVVFKDILTPTWLGRICKAGLRFRGSRVEIEDLVLRPTFRTSLQGFLEGLV